MEQADAPLEHAEAEPGVAVNSRNSQIVLDGLPTPEAKIAITAWLERARARQEDGQLQASRLAVLPPAVLGRAVPDRARRRGSHRSRRRNRSCPFVLPDLEDFKPTGKPEPPLSKATEWVRYSEKYRRETNTMPQWAGSCWYYLRYIDPAQRQARRGTRRRRGTGCPSIFTSAGPSTRFCTCSTAGSGTRCCSTAASSARPSRSRS